MNGSNEKRLRDVSYKPFICKQEETKGQSRANMIYDNWWNVLTEFFIWVYWCVNILLQTGHILSRFSRHTIPCKFCKTPFRRMIMDFECTGTLDGPFVLIFSDFWAKVVRILLKYRLMIMREKFHWVPQEPLVTLFARH